MKKVSVVLIAILFFVVATTASVYAETVLASKHANITEQESIENLIHRLVKEAIEEAKKKPCVLKAFEAGKEGFEVGVRVTLENGGVTVEIVTEESCD